MGRTRRTGQRPEPQKRFGTHRFPVQECRGDLVTTRLSPKSLYHLEQNAEPREAVAGEGEGRVVPGAVAPSAPQEG